jgi:hypothetical protein
VLIGRDPVVVTHPPMSTACWPSMPTAWCTRRGSPTSARCAILASGKNVVTTAFLFHPSRLPVADRDRLLAACHTGGQRHGSGLNPGNLSGHCRWR